MSKEDKILEKVKKLLALAGNNPSQAEAEAAAAKAQALLQEYNLTLKDVDGGEEEALDFTYFETGVDRAWKYDLANVIAKNFRCKCCWWGKSKVGFYGYKHDTEVAASVFEFLFWAIRRNLRKVKKQAMLDRGTAKGVIYSYSTGFIAGIKEVLDAQCTALMIVTPEKVSTGWEVWGKANNLKDMPINRRDKKGFNTEDYEKGKVDGRSAMNSRSIEA